MSDRTPEERREERRQARRDANERHHRRGELLEAIAEFKRVTGLSYVPFVEVLRIARGLGYGRVPPADAGQADESRDEPPT